MISKPKRSDFPTGRQGSESYNAAIKKYRDAVKRQKSKDPRPTYSDSKYPNYEAFRKDVKAWKKRNQKPKEQKRNVSPYERKHGKKQPGVGNNNLKIKKGEPFAKDRVGKVDLESLEYKEAKSINERKQQDNKPKDNKPKDNKPKDNKPKDNKQKDNKVKTQEKKYKQVTQAELDKKLAEKNKLKIKKGSAKNFIKTKKGFARRGTPMAKRAEERERRRKKLASKGYMKR